MDLFQKLGKEDLKGLFDKLESAFAKYNINFYIIGALARDIMLKGKYDITVPRATGDVDIAVLIPQYDIFQSTKRLFMR
jgi:predicted nucleotidyltransferase